MRPDAFLADLRRLLPSGWTLEFTDFSSGSAPRRADGSLTVAAPDGSTTTVLVEVKARLRPRQAREIAMEGRPRLRTDRPASGLLVLTGFVSPLSRKRLREAGICYLDLTGNAWISLEKPAVYIERQGAERDPDPPRRGVRTLKGAKAGRIVRGLCDWLPPVGVRELARRTDTDPGYVTRVLTLLEDEDVLSRDEGGEVVEVRWADLLRRWASDYSVTKTNRTLLCVAPRGLPHLVERLPSLERTYAVTGSYAVPPAARVAPGRVVTCYVPVPELAAERLDLVQSETGANVLLLEPFDRVVFERTCDVAGTRAVAVTQCFVDLLTGTGREPAQAEALLGWMTENEREWRT
jgi:hypothetical protein